MIGFFHKVSIAPLNKLRMSSSQKLLEGDLLALVSIDGAQAAHQMAYLECLIVYRLQKNHLPERVQLRVVPNDS